MSGTKYEDPNADGAARGPPVPARTAWTIRVYTDTATPTLVTSTTTSTVDGTYKRRPWTPGSYLVCEVVQSGLFQSFPCRHRLRRPNIGGVGGGGQAR